MLEPGTRRTREEELHDCKEPDILLGHLLGVVDTDLGEIRGDRLRVGVRQRNGIPVIVLRFAGMRMPPVMVGMRVFSGSVVIVVMIQIQHAQPRIMMEGSRPDHQGQDGKA